MNERIRITPEKCIACRRCEVACIAVHHGLAQKDAMKERNKYAARVQVVKAEGLKSSVRCHQCEPAPCCMICPTGALHQDKDGHIELHDELCVACRMCISACPYGVIRLENIYGAKPELPQAGQEAGAAAAAGQEIVRQVAVRCDMCVEWRKETGKNFTACMEACPVRALYMVAKDGSKVEAPPLPKKTAVKKDKPAAVKEAKAEAAPAEKKPEPAKEAKPEAAEAPKQA